VPLAGLGMPNCFAHTSLDVTLGFVPTGSTTALPPLVFPPVAAFAGFTLYAQVAVLDAGITPADLATSNGGVIRLGLY
jgi:hypothetical protein